MGTRPGTSHLKSFLKRLRPDGVTAPPISNRDLSRSNRDRAPERSEKDESLAYRLPQGLDESPAVEAELVLVLVRAHERLVVGDGVALVVHDHELAVLLEHEVHDPLDE